MLDKFFKKEAPLVGFGGFGEVFLDSSSSLELLKVILLLEVVV